MTCKKIQHTSGASSLVIHGSVNTKMSRSVRILLPAHESTSVIFIRHASVHKVLGNGCKERVVEGTSQALILDVVGRSVVQSDVCERSIGNTAVRSSPVSSKASDGVKDGGCRHVSDITGLVPVTLRR